MAITNSMSQDFPRFILLGLVNTLLSFLLYLYLLSLMGYFFAYTVSYCVGIFLSYFLNAYFVFKRKVELKIFLKFPVVYACQYVSVATILWLIQASFGFSPPIAMIIAVISVTPLTFLAIRFAFNKSMTTNSN